MLHLESLYASQPNFHQQVQALHVATELGEALEERHAALRVLEKSSMGGRHAALTLLEEVEFRLCQARTHFTEEIQHIHQEHWDETGIVEPQDQALDALITLWDFEIEWENENWKEGMGEDATGLFQWTPERRVRKSRF